MDEQKKLIQSIFKYVYQNPAIHKNTVRKKLLQNGKASSKGKFFIALDKLISCGHLIVEKENLKVNPNLISPAIFQKKGEECFVVTNKSNKHYPISKSEASGYKSGDILDVIVNSGETDMVFVLGKSQNTQTIGKPQEIEKPAAQNLILGRVVKLSHNNLVFIPNKKNIQTRQIPILNDSSEHASFQDKICLMSLVNPEAPLLGGYIKEVKGEAGNPVHEYDAIAESYGAIMNWDGDIIEDEIAKIPTSVDASKLDLIDENTAKIYHKGKTVDLRHIPFTTVDPKTCKDMDDAIYSTFSENGDIVCYVAVANVTKYVNLTSEIGSRYLHGAFTIYAPNKAYNILPSKLSTGICSLNPNEDRLAFVVKAVIDPSNGKVKETSIYDAIITSRKKLSYEEAQAIVDTTKDDTTKSDLFGKTLTGTPLSLNEQVLMNYYAGETIKLGFENRKMIRFISNNEREIVFDQDLQNVVDINEIPHLFYHEVIEAFMITANEATAKYAKDNNLDNIYRVHDEPNKNKLERASEFFDILNINFDGDLSAEGTRSLIELIKDTSSEDIINKFLIKMQSRAKYSEKLYNSTVEKQEEWLGEKISHYALQSPHYSHTTSPIRRLPDYVTQFNILAHMHGTKPIPKKLIEKIRDIANDRQLDVDQAEKDFDDISSVMYSEKHIGEKFSGRVTKIRYTSPEEGYEDDIVVIAKNDAKGIHVEIPLSQVIGRNSLGCELSKERCAVYDERGNILLTLCKEIDFIIEKADRKTMIVVGRTNKEIIKSAEDRKNYHNKNLHSHNPNSYAPSFHHSKAKLTHEKRRHAASNHPRHTEDEQEM